MSKNFQKSYKKIGLHLENQNQNIFRIFSVFIMNLFSNGNSNNNKKQAAYNF